MKKITLFLFALAVSVLAFDADLALEAKTRRISKGKVSNPDPVGLIELKLQHEGMYFKAFAIDDLTEINSSKGIDRYDIERVEYTVGYAYKFNDVPGLKSLTIDASYQYTDYQEDMEKKGDSENEVFLKLKSGLSLEPGIKLNYDLDYYYWYVNTFISWSTQFFILNQEWKLKQELHLYFYNDRKCKCDLNVDRGMFTVLFYKAYLSTKINSWMTAGPLFEAAYALDGSARQAYRDSSKNNAANFLVGIKVDMKF